MATRDGTSDKVATLYKTLFVECLSIHELTSKYAFSQRYLLWVKRTSHHAAAHQKAGKIDDPPGTKDPWGNKV